MAVRDVSHMLWPAVRQTISQLDLDSDKDAAAAKLAEQYARTIDDAAPGKDYFARLRWLGPELQKILESLGATPAARAAIKRGSSGGSGSKPKSQLDVLREQRARRTRA